MKNILIFSGTSEGRLLSKRLSDENIGCIVSVATEYGNQVMDTSSNVRVFTGRMTSEEMEKFIAENDCGIVVDATHPFAVEASQNIKAACKNCDVKAIRLLRATVTAEEKQAFGEDKIIVNSLQEAVTYLNTTTGNIFVTTGSKEIGELAEKIDDKERLYARVLPNSKSIGLCEKAGIKGSNIYAMQGPFDVATNRLMLRLSGAKYILTKESGEAGGFEEKISAAKEEKVTAVVIKRPLEQGMSLEETLSEIKKYYNQAKNSEFSLTLVGIGMGACSGELTGNAYAACENAKIIFGAKRILESLSWCRAKKVPFYTPDKIMGYLRENAIFDGIVVAFSGDTGFYSGANAFSGLKDVNIKILPGITTVQYFAAKLKIPWQDIELCSLHGVKNNHPNLIGSLSHGTGSYKRVFLLCSSAGDVGTIARELVDFGFGEVKLYIAVNLSYPDERIYIKKAEELADFCGEGLVALILENNFSEKKQIPYFHMPDEFFTRSQGDGKKVPMTKAEVRAVSVAKLMLEPDSIVYDVGAGTGSVAVESACFAQKGQVYAIEKNPEALKLIDINRKKAGCGNITIVEGEAPSVFDKLPAPTHAFIGGSGGRLKEILSALYAKNPDMNIVVNALTLETQAEILSYIKEHNLAQAEITTVQVARGESVAAYHLMRGENPVMIVKL